jgi:hypothetical protein
MIKQRLEGMKNYRGQEIGEGATCCNLKRVA